LIYIFTIGAYNKPDMTLFIGSRHTHMYIYRAWYTYLLYISPLYVSADVWTCKRQYVTSYLSRCRMSYEEEATWVLTFDTWGGGYMSYEEEATWVLTFDTWGGGCMSYADVWWHAPAICSSFRPPTPSTTCLWCVFIYFIFYLFIFRKYNLLLK